MNARYSRVCFLTAVVSLLKLEKCRCVIEASDSAGRVWRQSAAGFTELHSANLRHCVNPQVDPSHPFNVRLGKASVES